MSVEEIDFENFQIEPEKAHTLRSQVQKVKDENWVSDIQLILTEKGQSEAAPSKPGETLHLQIPGLEIEGPQKIFRLVENDSTIWTLVEQNPEIKVFKNAEPVLEATALPKGQEFALLYIDDQKLKDFASFFENHLKPQIKDARSKKSQRAAAFKAKFEKAEITDAPQP